MEGGVLYNFLDHIKDKTIKIVTFYDTNYVGKLIDFDESFIWIEREDDGHILVSVESILTIGCNGKRKILDREEEEEDYT